MFLAQHCLFYFTVTNKHKQEELYVNNATGRDRALAMPRGRKEPSIYNAPGEEQSDIDNATAFLREDCCRGIAVVGRIDRQRGELVAVEVEEEPKRIVEEGLDGRIESGHEDETAGGIGDAGVPDAHDVVGGTEGTGVHECGMAGRAVAIVVLLTLNVPELNRPVGRSGHERRGVLQRRGMTNVEGPDGTVVRVLLVVDDIARRHVEEEQMALARSQDDMRVAGEEGSAEAVVLLLPPALLGHDVRDVEGMEARSIGHVPDLDDALGHRARQGVVRRQCDGSYARGMAVHVQGRNPFGN